MFPLIGLIVGLLIGLLLDIDIPSAYSSYVAVGILAAIDSVIGALVANLKNTFDTKCSSQGFSATVPSRSSWPPWVTSSICNYPWRRSLPSATGFSSIRPRSGAF